MASRPDPSPSITSAPARTLIPHSGLVLTDGACWLARNGAAWLIYVIASVRHRPLIRAEEQEFWTLQVDLKKSCGSCPSTWWKKRCS
ncbi:DUF6876 family protein [Gluconacetobacter azotocaptans]|uniref:DUF6876 family protein n=1 Tax=Gluconacetobacter azotocaptans TaxID=142834 RepID=UPI003570DEAF